MNPLLLRTRCLRLALLAACCAISWHAPGASAQAGVPVPEDSPLYKAFAQLKSMTSYRIIMSLQSSDPRMAQMAAMGMGFGPIDKVVQGGAQQVTMHMKMPATDVKGMIDDWEIRAVVQNGRAARLITSPSVPRYLKLGDQMLQMQMMMLEKQAGMAVTRAAAEGPIGAISAAAAVSQLAQGMAAAASLRKKAKDFFSWQCLDQPVGQDAAGKGPSQLTDLRVVGEKSVDGSAATDYEFYVKDGNRSQGPVHFLVTKDTGLPLRIEMTDPQGRGSMNMDYSDFNKAGTIEIPDCLKGGQ